MSMRLPGGNAEPQQNAAAAAAAVVHTAHTEAATLNEQFYFYPANKSRKRMFYNWPSRPRVERVAAGAGSGPASATAVAYLSNIIAKS